MPVAEMLYRDGELIASALRIPSNTVSGFYYFVVIATCSIFNILVWAALRPSLVALAK